jgi:hypothetical protein
MKRRCGATTWARFERDIASKVTNPVSCDCQPHANTNGTFRAHEGLEYVVLYGGVKAVASIVHRKLDPRTAFALGGADLKNDFGAVWRSRAVTFPGIVQQLSDRILS